MKDFLAGVDVFIEWLKGKKSYFVSIVGILVAIAELFGVKIPSQVYTIIAGLFGVTMAAKVNRNLL